MTIRNGIKYLWWAILSAWLICCSHNDTLTGGSTEVGNTIAGTIKDTSGPAEGVLVTLYPGDFNPVSEEVPDSLCDTTDGGGEFLFKVAKAGIYNIQAFRPEDNTAALIRGVEIPDADTDTAVTAPNAKLNAVGAVTIHLKELAVEEDGQIYVPGTGITKAITMNDMNNGYLTVENLPPVTYSAIHYAEAGVEEEINILQEGNVNVPPGETVEVGPFHAWPDTAKIIINTSPTGADINENIHDFPLLVRIDSQSQSLSKSIFASTQPDGAGLRFARPDGLTPVPYEIEHWDSDNKLAEIWVLIDTIHAKNDSQFIYMYTGKNGAYAQSLGKAVFDTANGFFSVWHLSEDSGQAMDATPFAN
ncbi:MAG: DUF2341 domain-containing protein, partial [Planctomycetes bacterium]|nr:DUF2341 domain-containing protein [Planctomycetota bacterium]